MIAPMNRGESDMVTEDFLLNLSPLLSPRWSQLCLTPSPPLSFLPSSSSMVMHYQGSNQSMDDPPQNQEHDDIVDPAPYFAGDSALLQQQQQLRKNWSEASSDWRPRGGGIMRMNNQGFEESNMGFEESEEMMTTCFYFPPSPTNFPLYRPMPISITKLKSSCREYGIQRWPPRNEHKLIRQSLPNAIPAVVDQEGIPHLTSDTMPSNQALMATVDTNNFFEKEILLPQLLPTAQQENPDVGFGNDEDEAIGMEFVGTMEGVMVEAQLYSGCSGNGKWKEKSPGGERGKNGTTGVRIAIAKEDILQTKGMRLKDAAKHLEVSRSTFKRACREYGIKRWPPRKENKLVSQSCRKESPAIVDQEGIQSLNCDILPSDHALAATVDTNNVILKVRCINDIIVKFPLSWPWKMVELEQQVEKRLKLKSGTYYIKYKDEENDIVCILCDEDLQNYISCSTPLGTSSIEVFVVPK